MGHSSSRDVALGDSDFGVHERRSSACEILTSFIVMALCFSLNHGTVTACIPLASSEFGKSLGSYSLGILYLFYMLTAMFLSTIIVAKVGQKWSLVLGTGIYCFYVASYTISIFVPAIKWYAAIFGAILGGTAAGFLWTAQGGYFGVCAAQYAKTKGISKEEATSTLSGIFATVYLGFELLMKLCSALILVAVCGDDWNGDFITGKCKSEDLKLTGKKWVFGIFTTAAVISCILMAFIRQVEDVKPQGQLSKPLMDDEDGDQAEQQQTCASSLKEAKFFQALNLLFTKKMLLLCWFNIEFGLLGSYLNTYVTGTVIKEGLGEDKIGYFVSIIPVVATAMSPVLAWTSNKLGSKVPALILGNLCFLTFGLAFLVTEDPAEHLASWSVLVPLFCVYGIARATWEGPWKGVFADMFPGQNVPAFANIILQNGASSTLAFFIYPSISNLAKEWPCVIIAGVSLVSYLVAVGIDKKDKTALAQSLDFGPL